MQIWRVASWVVLYYGGLAGAAMADDAISIAKGWTPSAAKGADTPLFMTIKNNGPPDALLRATCTIANFIEQHTVDRGEGFPSMRVVKSIPIAANGVTQFGPDGYHVMLLQTTRALAENDTFHCTLSFRNAGKQGVDVVVGNPG